MEVLVIDDNRDITDAISLFFQSQDIVCEVANKGKEGLEAIRKKNHDLVILDIAMPEFSGHDVVNSLNEDGVLKTKNVVILTASNLIQHSISDMLALGIKEVMKKPLSLDELQGIVDRFRN